MKPALRSLTLAGLTAAAVLAACVPTLPGELDPGATGAAGTGGVAGGAGGAGRGSATGGSAVTGIAASGGITGPTGVAAQGGGAGTPVLCDPGCTPIPGCQDQAPATPDSISRFESACTGVDPVDGRDGGWFVWGGGTSTVSPNPALPFRVSCLGAAGSCFSACVSGMLSGTGYPSVILGVALRNSARVYDASAYGSVVFSVLGGVGPNAALRFKVPLAADTMVGNGDGTCTTDCFDAYATPLLGSGPNGGFVGWENREIRFKDLRQAGWGAPEPWDPTTVISLQWEIFALTETVAATPFMICIDQVGLVPR